MSDGREEREENKWREQQKRADDEDRIDPPDADESQPERVDS